MALAFLFDPNKQFQSLGGVNEVGGFLRVFLNGTDDRATTYKNFDGTLNESDIELDANGRAVVIVDNTKTYRLEVYNRLGGLMWTVSNFTAQGGSGGGGTPVSVEGTEGEVDVDSYSSGGILHFVVGLAQTIKDTLTSLSSSVTSLMASIGLCELVSNKKDTLTGYEASTTDYPSIKAVVDFVNSAMQNMGGKLITDNGDPFTDSSDLPSTTPYGGVDIDDKDYAYVQNAGSAERWSATVVGSSVAWVQEYAINIPVFTPSQQAAIDSGITATMVNDLKPVAFSGVYSDLSGTPTIPTVNNGKLTISRNGTALGSFTANQSSLIGIDISVPTKTSDLVNDSLLINDGTLTITQNGTSKGTFTANQLGSTTIALTDTTYESKAASSGGTAESLVTTGEKYTWNMKQNALPIIISNPLRYDIQVVYAYNSTNASYASNVGTQSSHPQIGGFDRTLFVDSSGSHKMGWRVPSTVADYAHVTNENVLQLEHHIQNAYGTGAKDSFMILCYISSDNTKINVYAYAPSTVNETWYNAILDGTIQWVGTSGSSNESYTEEIDGRIPTSSARRMLLGSFNLSSTLKQKIQANLTMRLRSDDLNVNKRFMVNTSISILKSAGTSSDAYVYGYSNMIMY